MSQKLGNDQRSFYSAAGTDTMAKADVSAAELAASIQKHLERPKADTAAFLMAAYDGLRALAVSTPTSDVIEGLIAIGHFYALSANPVPGLEPASDAVIAALRTGDQQLLMKAKRLQSWLLADSGNFPDAVTTVHEALTMAQNIGDETAECACWNFLGVYFQLAGLPTDAMAYFERAIELAGDDPMRSTYKRVAFTNTAAAALEIGDFKRALPAARVGAADEGEPSNAVEADTKAMSHHILARALMQVGALERASDQLSKAQRFAELAGTRRALTNVDQTRALLEIAVGQTQAGLKRMSRTLEEARTVTGGGLLPQVLADAVQAYESAGRPDIALSLLRDLFKLRRKHQGEQLALRMRAPTRREQLSSRDNRIPDPLIEKARLLEDKVERAHRVLADGAADAALVCRLDVRRPYRVSKLVELFAAHQGLQADVIEVLKAAGLLADIGMVAVPNAILFKERALSPAERALVEEHVRHGAQLLEDVGLEIHRAAAEFVRLHHERWDGLGPHRLAAEEIPLGARLLSLCDAFEGMTHKRAWREALSVPAAIQDIQAARGTRFDPALAQEFAEWLREEYWKHRDFDSFLGEEAESSAFVRAKEQIAGFVERGGRGPANFRPR